jgi:hypothetical protein
MGEARSIGVTAFDLFGILLPGALLVLAGRIILTPSIGPLPITLDHVGIPSWLAIGLVCYIAGHLVQLLARITDRLTSLIWPWGEIFRMSVGTAGQPETASALALIRQRLAERTGLSLESLSDVVLSNLTDEFLEQYGNAATLANYRSREVYYRGISAAMVLLAIAFATLSWRGVPAIAAPATLPVSIVNGALGVLGLLVAIAAGNAHRRQRRRRMRHSLLGYLVLETGGRLGDLPPAYRSPHQPTA